MNEEVKSIAFAIAEGTRPLMIETILDNSNDEFETKLDVVKLAVETDKQLKFRLVSILNYIIDNN